MKLKLIAGLVVLLVTTLMVIGVGCNKATGGGWFLNEDGSKVTFGFNAQPVDSDGDGIVDAAKGELQLVDHGNKPPTKIHGTFITTFPDVEPGFSMFFGTCSINGDEGHTLMVAITDAGEPGPSAGDNIAVWVDTGNLLDPPTYGGVLGGGNLQIH